jgi:hypothetical protein
VPRIGSRHVPQRAHRRGGWRPRQPAAAPRPPVVGSGARLDAWHRPAGDPRAGARSADRKSFRRSPACSTVVGVHMPAASARLVAEPASRCTEGRHLLVPEWVHSTIKFRSLQDQIVVAEGPQPAPSTGCSPTPTTLAGPQTPVLPSGAEVTGRGRPAPHPGAEAARRVGAASRSAVEACAKRRPSPGLTRRPPWC